MSISEIQNWILSQFTYMTENQLKLQNHWITPIPCDPNSPFLVANHPEDGQNSVHARHRMDSLIPSEHLGANQTPKRRSTEILLEALRGEVSFTSSEVKEMTEHIEYLKAQEALQREELSRLAKDHEDNSYDILVYEKIIDANSLERNYFEKLLSFYWAKLANDSKASALRAQELQAAVHALDYRNGSVALASAISEVLRQKAYRRLHHKALQGIQKEAYLQYGKAGIDSYFIIELPYLVSGPEGKNQPAAILGRQSSFRWMTFRGGLKSAAVIDPLGGAQTDMFGHPVDFERVIFPGVSDFHPRMRDDRSIMNEAARIVSASKTQNWLGRHPSSQKLVDELIGGMTKARYPEDSEGALNLTSRDDFILHISPLPASHTSMTETEKAEYFDSRYRQSGAPKEILAYQFVKLARQYPQRAALVLVNTLNSLPLNLVINGVIPAIADNPELLERTLKWAQTTPWTLIQIFHSLISSRRREFTNVTYNESAHHSSPIVRLLWKISGHHIQLQDRERHLELIDWTSKFHLHPAGIEALVRVTIHPRIGPQFEPTLQKALPPELMKKVREAWTKKGACRAQTAALAGTP